MDPGLSVVVVLVVLAVMAAVILLVGYGRRYRQEQQRIESALSDRPAHTDDLQLGADPPAGGWHGPSCSGGFPAVDPARPAVPEQRTGDHDQQEPPRSLAGRLLRRRGSSEPG